MLPQEGPHPRCVWSLFHRPGMPWKCLVALHMVLLLPSWFGTLWHLSVILASHHSPFPGHKVFSGWELSCALSAPVPFMWCSEEPRLHEGGEITTGFHPSPGAWDLHTQPGLRLARKKHLWWPRAGESSGELCTCAVARGRHCPAVLSTHRDGCYTQDSLRWAEGQGQGPAGATHPISAFLEEPPQGHRAPHSLCLRR